MFMFHKGGVSLVSYFECGDKAGKSLAMYIKQSSSAIPAIWYQGGRLVTNLKDIDDD